MNCKEHADNLRQAIEACLSGRRNEATVRVVASEAATLRCCADLPDAAYKKVGMVFQWAKIYFAISNLGQGQGKLRQVELRLRQELSRLQSSLQPEKSSKT